MTMDNEKRPGETVTEWGMRMVRDAGAAAEQTRIAAALDRLFDGRNCVNGDAGCVCELIATATLQPTIQSILSDEHAGPANGVPRDA